MVSTPGAELDCAGSREGAGGRFGLTGGSDAAMGRQNGLLGDCREDSDWRGWMREWRKTDIVHVLVSWVRNETGDFFFDGGGEAG